MTTAIVTATIALLLLAWALGTIFLRGPDLTAFDRPDGRRFGGTVQEGHLTVVAMLATLTRRLRKVPLKGRLAATRQAMDTLFDDPPGACTFAAVDAGGVPGEWVLAPGADGARRTLYLHGGAFATGSPRSHRRLTTEFARMTGGAVLAIDYRLMPEHSRRAGIEDSRCAYRWMLAHGPAGAQTANTVFVAGDSAGGTLALSLIAWVRDQGLRAADAVVALSPATDATLGSPSMRTNVATDPMLGPIFGSLARVPRVVLLWFGWVGMRIVPCDPRVSPVHGDLSGLPPTLVQASDAEMLRDDARRYVNRAVAAGSPATLQLWPHMVHVWQLFHPELAQAREALEEIERFLRAPTPTPDTTTAAAPVAPTAISVPGSAPVS